MIMFVYVILSVVIFLLVVYRLALSDIFFGMCQQGQIKVITKSGLYHDFFHSVGGYKKSGNKLIPGDENFDLLRKSTGLCWIGIWPIYKVHSYKFEWETIRENKIVSRNEEVNSVFFRFEYPLEFKNLETSDNFKVGVRMQILTETFCPELAIFKARNWLNVIKASIESKVRDFVGNYSFEEIRGQSTELVSNKDGFVRQVIDLSFTTDTDANPGFEDTVGTRIITANFQGIDADPSVLQALEAAARAKRDGEAKIIQAELEGRAKVIAAQKAAEAREIEARAEQVYLGATTLYVAQDPNAARIAQIQALPKTLQTLVQEGAVNVEIGNKEKAE